MGPRSCGGSARGHGKQGAGLSVGPRAGNSDLLLPLKGWASSCFGGKERLGWGLLGGQLIRQDVCGSLSLSP